MGSCEPQWNLIRSLISPNGIYMGFRWSKQLYKHRESKKSDDSDRLDHEFEEDRNRLLRQSTALLLTSTAIIE